MYMTVYVVLYFRQFYSIYTWLFHNKWNKYEYQTPFNISVINYEDEVRVM